MSLLRPAYQTRYGYSWRRAIVAEFWWRVEHLPLPDRLVGRAYAKRKQAERRGAAA